MFERFERFNTAFVLFVSVCVLILSDCSGGASGALPSITPSIPGVGVFDRSSQMCDVSYDDMVWYSVPRGSFSPIDVRTEHCPITALSANPSPAIPNWAKPNAPTQALFVATSLQEAYSIAGMQSIEAAGSASHTPITWMIGNPLYLGSAPMYNGYHQSNGDDVEMEQNASLIAAAQTVLPWFRPAVSVEGAGKERDVSQALAFGESGF